MTAKLFTPIDLGGITLSNRVVVSPMCQYSAADGAMTDWHIVHVGSLAVSRAGVAIVEATGVTREGRISHGCTGLYNDLNEAAMQRAVHVYRGITSAPIGVQLAHAGRKASAQVPWLGGKPLSAAESPWPTVAPSALPYAEGWHTPHELTADEIRDLADAFASSAARVHSTRCGASRPRPLPLASAYSAYAAAAVAIGAYSYQSVAPVSGCSRCTWPSAAMR